MFNCTRITQRKVQPFYQLNLFENKEHPLKEQQFVLNKIENKLSFEKALNLSDLVHFQLSSITPIQRWYPYREGFSIKLVDTFIKELCVKGNVFDPFVGSGTTLLSSRNHNLQSFGIDVNPISISVSEIANENYSKIDVKRIKDALKIILNETSIENKIETNFELAEKVFNKDILQVLLNLKMLINEIQVEKNKKLIFVAWLSILEQVSNVKKEGNGIKYKNRKRTSNGYIPIDKETWENNNFPKDKVAFVKSVFNKKMNIILNDVYNNFGLIKKKPRIFRENCINFNKLFNDEIEFTFFSPPYCNSFDYFEIHKVELWLGDYIKSKKELRLLKNSGFRSNTNALNGKAIYYSNPDVENLIGLFDYKKLWNKRIPNVVRGYFDDMYQLLRKLYFQTVKNGFVGIVVGNSAYSEIIIPTDAIIANIAKEIGFNLKKILVTRHLTTSSQQKIALASLNNYLRESIIILQK